MKSGSHEVMKIDIRNLRPRRRLCMAAATTVCLLVGPSPGLAQDICAGWGTSGSEAAEIESIRACLAAGADPDPRDKDGRTPLHDAAQGGRMEVVEVLLAAGADPDARSESGSTPLHKAARWSGKAEAIEALLAAGADPGARNKHGSPTPFDVIPDGSPLVGTSAYWRLHDARWD